MGHLDDIATAPKATGTPSIGIAFQILDMIAGHGGPVSMTEISRDLTLPKSTTFRVLTALESVGATVRNGRDKRYVIGPKFAQYAKAAPAPDIATRFLRDAGTVLRPLNETVQLGVLTHTEVTFVAYIDSTHPVRLVTYVGRTLPAHASAAGKAILAYSPPDAVEAVIAAGLPALTDHTITNETTLRNDLRRVRENGYATEEEESTTNLSCLAIPVFSPHGDIQGAISLCVPQATLPQARLAEFLSALRTAATVMSDDTTPQQLRA